MNIAIVLKLLVRFSLVAFIVSGSVLFAQEEQLSTTQENINEILLSYVEGANPADKMHNLVVSNLLSHQNDFSPICSVYNKAEAGKGLFGNKFNDIEMVLHKSDQKIATIISYLYLDNNRDSSEFFNSAKKLIFNHQLSSQEVNLIKDFTNKYVMQKVNTPTKESFYDAIRIRNSYEKNDNIIKARLILAGVYLAEQIEWDYFLTASIKFNFDHIQNIMTKISNRVVRLNQYLSCGKTGTDAQLASDCEFIDLQTESVQLNKIVDSEILRDTDGKISNFSVIGYWILLNRYNIADFSINSSNLISKFNISDKSAVSLQAKLVIETMNNKKGLSLIFGDKEVKRLSSEEVWSKKLELLPTMKHSRFRSDFRYAFPTEGANAGLEYSLDILLRSTWWQFFGLSMITRSSWEASLLQFDMPGIIKKEIDAEKNPEVRLDYFVNVTIKNAIDESWKIGDEFIGYTDKLLAAGSICKVK
jgi:hypothetical protein